MEEKEEKTKTWKEVEGKDILLRAIPSNSIVEAKVLRVSGSGKYVKFRWAGRNVEYETWEEPTSETFRYKLLENL